MGMYEYLRLVSGDVNSSAELTIEETLIVYNTILCVQLYNECMHNGKTISLKQLKQIPVPDSTDLDALFAKRPLFLIFEWLCIGYGDDRPQIKTTSFLRVLANAPQISEH